MIRLENQPTQGYMAVTAYTALPTLYHVTRHNLIQI
jgi:hypothetical protein